MIEKFTSPILEVLSEEGYSFVRELPTVGFVGLLPHCFTVGLFCGLTIEGCAGRYCYPTLCDAIDAIQEWDGSGDPPGPWIKHKPSERLGPGAKFT